jgi:hypothetical protein
VCIGAMFRADEVILTKVYIPTYVCNPWSTLERAHSELGPP